ncbi:hypothetical protein L209DRAFT_516903 [Thermothelomyces heterothallicus CBS 203.75]
MNDLHLLPPPGPAADTVYRGPIHPVDVSVGDFSAAVWQGLGIPTHPFCVLASAPPSQLGSSACACKEGSAREYSVLVCTDIS